ncbi:MAG: alpha/beta hydrolase-fold protein [Myxococcota bacterium]
MRFLVASFVLTTVECHRETPTTETHWPPSHTAEHDVAKVHKRSFTFEGLKVAEVVLGADDPDAPLPLVMMLHGRGDRPRIPGGPFEHISTPMRILIPRGPFRVAGGFAWSRVSVTEGRHNELAVDLLEVSSRLSRLVAHVGNERPTLGTPVATGFSQGGMVAWTMAVRYPDQLGLALPLAAWVPPRARPQPLKSAPVQSMHGTADRIVRIEPTRNWVNQLRRARNRVEWREFDGVGHEVTPEMNRQLERWLEQALQERTYKGSTSKTSSTDSGSPAQSRDGANAFSSTLTEAVR